MVLELCVKIEFFKGTFGGLGFTHRPQSSSKYEPQKGTTLGPMGRGLGFRV